MITYESNINLEELLKEILDLSFFIDGSKAKMAYRPGEKPIITKTYIKKAVEEICKYCDKEILYLMINILPAGIEVPIHTDTLENKIRTERWHLPVKTNDKCKWWDSGLEQAIHMKQGFWHGPVPYWKNHAVNNLGDEDRVHIVVDLFP